MNRDRKIGIYIYTLDFTGFRSVSFCVFVRLFGGYKWAD